MSICTACIWLRRALGRMVKNLPSPPSAGTFGGPLMRLPVHRNTAATASPAASSGPSQSIAAAAPRPRCRPGPPARSCKPLIGPAVIQRPALQAVPAVGGQRIQQRIAPRAGDEVKPGDRAPKSRALLLTRCRPRDDRVRGAQAVHVSSLRIGLGCGQAPRADVFPTPQGEPATVTRRIASRV